MQDNKTSTAPNPPAEEELQDDKSCKELETKLAWYLETMSKLPTEKLRQAKGEKNVLHYLIKTLSGTILTDKHASIASAFMSKMLSLLTERGVLEEMSLDTNKVSQNILHLLVLNSLGFLISLFRKTLKTAFFSQLVLMSDGNDTTALYLAAELGDTEAFDEIMAGATQNDLSLVTVNSFTRLIYSIDMQPAESQDDQAIIISLTMRLVLHIDEYMRFNPHFIGLFEKHCALVESEEEILDITDFRGDNVFFVFLRKLAKSGLSESNIIFQFQEFITKAGRPFTKKLMLSSNRRTGETILHILAEEKSLLCLLSQLDPWIAANIPQLLAADAPGGETPFHIAVHSQNLEFILFLRENVNDNSVLETSGAQKKTVDGQNVFHRFATSCFNQHTWDLKDILEGRKPFPAEPMSRWVLSNVMVSDDAHQIFAELIELYGDQSIPMFCENDNFGNNFLNLISYLNNPVLFNSVLTIQLQHGNGSTVLSKAATQGLPNTEITPVQLLSGFGSAESLGKLLFILDKAAEEECVRINRYLGGMNALRSCYLSAIDPKKDDELNALKGVVTLLMSRMPPISENDLVQEVRPNVSLLTCSIMLDRCIAETAFFRTIPWSRGGRSLDCRHPVGLMMDILFNPPMASSSDLRLDNQSPHSPGFFTRVKSNESKMKNDCRINSLKKIFGLSFIPRELLEKMVELVTNSRLFQPQLSDRRLLLDLLLFECFADINSDDALKNHACVFLCSLTPSAYVPTENEGRLKKLFLENPEISIKRLKDFLTYLNSLLEGYAKDFLSQVFRGDSLLKQVLLLLFKEGKIENRNDDEQIQLIMK